MIKPRQILYLPGLFFMYCDSYTIKTISLFIGSLLLSFQKGSLFYFSQ
jgi:hypothetical protein